MNKIYLIATAAALLAAPLVLAHTDGGLNGTPKDYCEPQSEWAIHDYGPGAGVYFLGTRRDGNASGDCDLDGIPGDPDSHAEYAAGGAWIMACNGDGTSVGTCSGTGAGTEYCFGEYAHHVTYGSVSVGDKLQASGVRFWVTADTQVLVSVTNGCGDFETDESIECIDSCTVTFGPGLDGAYLVYVEGTSVSNVPKEMLLGVGIGHVDWP